MKFFLISENTIINLDLVSEITCVPIRKDDEHVACYRFTFAAGQSVEVKFKEGSDFNSFKDILSQSGITL